MNSKFVTIEDEYLRKPNLKKEDVEAIKLWMNKEPHLPKISDLDIALFLNSCYFKLEATKTCIENYFNLRGHCPEFFSKRDPFRNETQLALHTVAMFALNKTTQNDYIVIFHKLINTNPEHFILNDVLKMVDIGMTLLGPKRGLQNGHICVFDSEGIQLGHVFKLNPISLKKYVYFVQEAMPIRLKEIHVFNVSGITEKFVNVIKPLLKKEIAQMIYLHKNIEGLKRYLPENILPKDYGGQDKSIQDLHIESVRFIESHVDYLLEDEKLKTDESKRRGKRINYDNIFGVEGSFKKLELD